MNEKYTHRFNKVFLYIIGITFFAFGSIILVASIISFIQGKPISLFNFIKNFVGAIFFPLLIMYVDFLETDIQVDEHGLNLKSPIKTFRVNWEDVIEIRRARLLGLPMFNKPQIVITKSRLSPFHYLYGVIYASTKKPSFYFSSFISDSDVLRQTIIDHIKYNHQAKQSVAKNNDHLEVTNSNSRKNRKKSVSKKL